MADETQADAPAGAVEADGQQLGEEGQEQTADAEELPVIPPPACPVLAKIYGDMAFEPLAMVPGLPLSRIVASCWVDSGAEVGYLAGLAQSVAELLRREHLKVLPARLAKSKSLKDVNQLKLSLKDVQEELASIQGKKGMDEAREALQAKIDEINPSLEEAQAAFTELKASFQDDPQALTPWMNSLFDTADLGVTTFLASGSFWPRAPFSDVLSTAHGAAHTAGPEKLLSAFRKRYVLERGAETAPQVVYRLAPNALRVPVTEETISEAVARLMETAGIDPEAEAPEALDAVELCWWEGASAAGAARALRQLADMCREVVEVDEESGERTVTAPRKIRALGVFGFSARAIEDAVASGVTPAFAHLPVGFDSSAEGRAAVATCRRHGIHVIGSGVCMHGLLEESFRGLPEPHACAEPKMALELLTSAADAKDCVSGMGSWPAFQKVLEAAAGIAKKHGVTVQEVAMRWALDGGVCPVVPVAWGRPGASFGRRGCGDGGKPAGKLFMRDSFLDEEDVAALPGAPGVVA